MATRDNILIERVLTEFNSAHVEHPGTVDAVVTQAVSRAVSALKEVRPEGMTIAETSEMLYALSILALKLQNELLKANSAT
ncbi:hypothetical protein C4553_02750 [Candidatus Parcubacteria bacterium]|nr:MAG: hypothetical protein C4553_02750 [Candidatus Parcubacteria bacterium]